MAVQNGVQHRQPLTVIAVGVSAKLVLYHVALKVRHLAYFQYAVFSHGRRPDKLAASEFVLRVGNGAVDISDDIAHHSLVYLVGEILAAGRSEVGLHAVRKAVKCTRYDLTLRHCHCVFGVEDSKVIELSPKRCLEHFVGVCDDRTVILLGTRAECGNDCTDRDKLVGLTTLAVFKLPYILVGLSLCRDHLAGINNRAAAQCDYQFNIFLSCKSCTLLIFCVGRVRHYAAELRDGLACGFEYFRYLVKDAHSLDRASAVCKHNILTIFSKQIGQV